MGRKILASFVLFTFAFAAFPSSIYSADEEPPAAPERPPQEQSLEDALVTVDRALAEHRYEDAESALEALMRTRASQGEQELLSLKKREVDLLSGFWRSVAEGAGRIVGAHVSFGTSIGRVREADATSLVVETARGHVRLALAELTPREIYAIAQRAATETAEWHQGAALFCRRNALAADEEKELKKAAALGAPMPKKLLSLENYYEKKARTLFEQLTDQANEGHWSDVLRSASELLTAFASSATTVSQREKIERLQEAARSKKGLLDRFARFTANGVHVRILERGVEFIFEFNEPKELRAWSIAREGAWRVEDGRLHGKTATADVGLWLDVEFEGQMEIEFDVRILPLPTTDFDFQVAFLSPEKSSMGYRACLPSGWETKLLHYSEGGLADIGQPFSFDTGVDPEKTYRFEILTGPTLRVVRDGATLLKSNTALEGTERGFVGLVVRSGAEISRFRVVGTPTERWYEYEQARPAEVETLPAHDE